MEQAIVGLCVLVLVLCSSFFSLAEMSFLLASPVTLRHWADEGDSRAAMAAEMLDDDTNRVLTTINICDTVVNLLAIVLGTLGLMKYCQGRMVLVGFVVLFLAILVIGEMIPRLTAQRYENRIFCRIALPLMMLVTVFKPLTFVIGRGGRIIINRAGDDDDEDDEFVEEELLNIVDEAESEGDLEFHESDLIRSAINFEDLVVKDIFRPRVRVVAIDDEMDVRDVLDVFANTGYSRLPVYHDTIDNIIGVLHLKDVFNSMLDGELREYVPLVQPVEFVFLQTKASRLLLQLQRNQSHMAIITDEYGGTAGIVTLEDIIEELVGDIWDEHDNVEEMPIRVLAPSLYQVNANMDVDEFFEFFGLDFDDYEDDIEASSLGGWVVDLLDHIPAPGEVATYPPFTFTVEEVDKRHVERVRVVYTEPVKDED
ncbi:MAG: hemolysin family protein [Peptococcaceae bacterium]|nr:hemolysin family protein [Peptococcaceae bacterium]